MQHIIGYAPEGSEKPLVYFVVVSINALCDGCKRIHEKSDYLVFLHIDKGFVLLNNKMGVYLHDEGSALASLLMKLFGPDGLEQ